ncbi:malonate decarboxylase delta subunit [Alteribacillus persepolensis]|uniref:Malonate decarboxylase acyl carrier protein n=1 Tax=Alteribacillus persepolensis TaxID=568899 RepID=A0A1G8EAJ1_9BACI|nr:malonate decarboxylase subunit delta [Alteribacillus persepolensis]SDH66914.1 malonate decarboxylase delta subunit [Alteribacillus persepolensis]
MEALQFEFQTNEPIPNRAHVGVVGSGDLEIMMEPVEEPHTSVEVRTSIQGYEKMWRLVLERFIEENNISAKVKINDFGATPGVVRLRLEQALEVSKSNVAL